MSNAPQNSTLSPNAIEADKDGYVPLTTRLLAWWEGVGVDEINNLKADAVAIKVDSPVNKDFTQWNEHRFAVAQTIWGEDFLKPGGAAFTKEVLKSAKVSSKDTVLDLTAGMCGSAISLSSQHNLWMEAMEQNETIANKARNVLVKRGMSEKIKLTHQDLNTLKLDANKYDLIYSCENLYRQPAKKKIIEEVKHGLKKNGRFIFTDFVTGENAEKEIEKNPYYELKPWTTAQYLDALRAAELNVFAHQDMSAQYLKHINHAWHGLMKKMEDSSHTRDFIDQMMFEGELWLKRHKTIQAGQVKLMRFHCFSTH